MPKNLDAALIAIDGSPLRVSLDSDLIATIKTVAVNALLSDAEPQSDGAAKANRYLLAMRLNAGGEQEFTPEELTLIKRLVGAIYGPIVVGQVYEWAKV